MIADNVLRRQLNPMEQARLIKRLKEQYGIKPGPKGEGQGTSNSVTVTEIARVVGVEPETAKQLNRLNKLILPLQELVSAGRLGASNGSELAAMTIAQQQALVDAIGADAVADLKRTTIQAAKKAPDTAALAAHIAALEAERDDLQNQLQRTETAEQEGESSSSLVESLQSQLEAAEETRQHYADALARLQAQGPVERIVEKVVEVEKPVPDPAQAEKLAALESQLDAAQKRLADLTQVGEAHRDLDQIEHQRREAEKALKDAQAALAAVYRSTAEQTGYRAALGQFVQEATKRARPILSEWQRMAEHPRHSLNWGLYYDVQGLAGMLESVAAGLRGLELDPQASKKHVTAGQILDITASTSQINEGGQVDGRTHALAESE